MKVTRVVWRKNDITQSIRFHHDHQDMLISSQTNLNTIVKNGVSNEIFDTIFPNTDLCPNHINIEYKKKCFPKIEST